MENTDVAWLAGIVDGEGCIHIRQNLPSERSKHRSPMYSLVLKVSMCHKKTIEHIRQIVGMGHISRNAVANPLHQEGWAWYAMSKQAGEILHTIRPYLVTKAAECDAALEFLCLPPGKGGRACVPTNLLEKRQYYYHLLRAMKPRRGGRGGGFPPISLDTPNPRMAIDYKYLAHKG